METLFSEVLTKEEWLRMYDNVFSNHPSFLTMLAVAYCTRSRTPLLHCTEFDDFKVKTRSEKILCNWTEDVKFRNIGLEAIDYT